MTNPTIVNPAALVRFSELDRKVNAAMAEVQVNGVVHSLLLGGNTIKTIGRKDMEDKVRDILSRPPVSKPVIKEKSKKELLDAISSIISEMDQ